MAKKTKRKKRPRFFSGSERILLAISRKGMTTNFLITNHAERRFKIEMIFSNFSNVSDHMVFQYAMEPREADYFFARLCIAIGHNVPLPIPGAMDGMGLTHDRHCSLRSIWKQRTQTGVTLNLRELQVGKQGRVGVTRFRGSTQMSLDQAYELCEDLAPFLGWDLTPCG